MCKIFHGFVVAAQSLPPPSAVIHVLYTLLPVDLAGLDLLEVKLVALDLVVFYSVRLGLVVFNLVRLGLVGWQAMDVNTWRRSICLSTPTSSSSTLCFRPVARLYIIVF